jgi:hypothetical protein
MRAFVYGIWVLAFLVGSGLAQAQQPIGWQEAVARLAGERTKAEACVRLLKQYGDKAAVSQGELTYADAKGDVDGVIAGLIVALAKEKEPESLPDLETRLQQGVKGREAVCDQATALMPQTNGEKDFVTDLVSGAIGPVIDALKEIYLKHREQDLLTRTTIQNQLEATKWPAFDTIAAPH